jgi:hypothetical protein
MSSAAISISASTTRMSTRPTNSMNGSRSEAMIGGRMAFRTAIAAVAARAPLRSFTVAPGTISAATSSAAADRIHAITSRVSRTFGRLGLHFGASP